MAYLGEAISSGVDHPHTWKGETCDEEENAIHTTSTEYYSYGFLSDV